MTTKKLTELEMEPMRIASLPSRPTAPTAFGGKGYTSYEMKAAFDKLPNLIAERLNSLIDDITSGRISDTIPTKNASVTTLEELFDGIENGNLASAIKISDESLVAVLTNLRADLNTVAGRLGITL